MKTWLEISKSNLLNNVEEITKCLEPKTRFMAVIKSNAYGHGATEIAKILAQHRSKIKNELWFGVDSIWEGRTLISSTVQPVELPPILILGYTPREELKNIPKNVRLTIGSLKALQDAARSGKYLKIHLKIETGTMRQGIRVGDLNNAVRIFKNSKKIVLEGISSHFAEAEMQPTTLFTQKQLQIFYDASKILEKYGYKKLIRHIACSAAASHLSESKYDMVRTGINLYGLQSIDRHREERSDVAISGITVLHSQPSGLPRSAVAELAMTKPLRLKPILSWKTIVAQVKNIKKDETIGYGRLAKMPYNGQISILPIGYWDGYDRKLSGINRHRNAEGRDDLALPPGGLSRYSDRDPDFMSGPRTAKAGLAMTENGGDILIRGKRCQIIGRVCMNMCMAILPKNFHAKMGDEVVLIGKQGNAEVTAGELAHKIGTINYEVVTRINPLIPRIVN